MEHATRKTRTPRRLEEIPAFRAHLAREGLTLAQFEHRATTAEDLTGDALRLARRKLQITHKGK